MKRKVTTLLNCTVESASDTGVVCVTEPDSVTFFTNNVDAWVYVKNKLLGNMTTLALEKYREARAQRKG